MGVVGIAIRRYRITETGIDFSPHREVVTEHLGTTVVEIEWLGFTYGYRGVVAALKDYEVARWIADIGRIDRREESPILLHTRRVRHLMPATASVCNVDPA